MRGFNRKIPALFRALALLVGFLPAAHAERIKDLAQVGGVRGNALVGYGLVVGLDNSGDRTSQSPFTVQSLRNMLNELGVTVPANGASGIAVGMATNVPPHNLGELVAACRARGVLVALEGEGDKTALRELGRKIAMHVAATAPLSLNTDDLDPAAIEKERAVLIEKAKEEGRPEAMIEKIVEGQINKFQKDVVLSKQPFVMDPDVTIEQLVANSAKELGSSNLHLAGFVRLALGEGVEKVEGPDFASEVASMMGGN